MTPLLNRIEQALATCTDPIRRAELLAERACYYARTGNFAGANAILVSLRETYGDGRSAQISAWIMLIEGLVLYFHDNSEKAGDRIFRAYVLSKAARLSKLASLAGAWLAHMEFEVSEYESMATTVADVLELSDPDSHDVLSRLGMVLGDAYLYAGDRNSSQRWYEHSRWHSNIIGDQATIGALMYNRVAFGIAALRVLECSNIARATSLNIDFIEMELNSAISFQTGTGVRALTYLLELCRGRVAVMRDRFETGAEIFSELLARSEAKNNRFDSASIQVDLVWCLAKCNRKDDALRVMGNIDVSAIDRLGIDDQLVAVTALMRIAETLAVPPVLADFEVKLSELHAAYCSDIEKLRNALAKISLTTAL